MIMGIRQGRLRQEQAIRHQLGLIFRIRVKDLEYDLLAIRYACRITSVMELVALVRKGQSACIYA